ncbi:MAG: hypothetical protein IH845_01880 [Nanoarchaeota archaeon]|nr:hypothetical protein [Nanoarchaeota archaeon]
MGKTHHGEKEVHHHHTQTTVVNANGGGFFNSIGKSAGCCIGILIVLAILIAIGASA